MFGAFRIAKARAACKLHLSPYVYRAPDLGPWPPHFWHDAFVLGFITNGGSIVSRLVTGGKISSQQAGHALVGAVNDLGGNSADFTERIAALSQQHDRDFLFGAQNAEKVFTYIMKLHPMSNDLDVAAATEMARSTNTTGNPDYAEIGGSLIYLLFQAKVEQRLEG